MDRLCIEDSCKCTGLLIKDATSTTSLGVLSSLDLTNYTDALQ